MKKYGLIIIGAGVTGLSAGIAWMKNTAIGACAGGALIIEKQPKAGGCVTSFGRQGYLFDTCQFIPAPQDILEYLGVDIELVRLKGDLLKLVIADTYSKTSKTIRIPSGFSDFRQFMCDSYPAVSGKINTMLTECRKMYDELYKLRLNGSITGMLRTVIDCPRTVLNSGKTFRQYYTSFGIKDTEVDEIFEAFADFSSLPSDRVAALLAIGAMNTSLDGAYRPKKGFVEFPNAMKKRFLELGGEILFNEEAAGISIKDNKARGVELKSGKSFGTEKVITTIDPKVAAEKLIGYSALEVADRKYAHKIRYARMSPSALNIALGLNDDFVPQQRGFDCGFTVLTTGKGAFGRLFKGFDQGRNCHSEDLFRMGMISPSAVTGGKNTLNISVMPYSPAGWKELKETDPDKYLERKNNEAEFFIDKADTFVSPGLKQAVKVKDVSTPATFMKYLSSPTGSVYDMSPYPDNFGQNRLKMRMPVEGIYQPKFSHGVWPSLQSGLQAVDMITGGGIMKGYARFRKK